LIVPGSDSATPSIIGHRPGGTVQPKLGYRPDVDGLRALAVLAVIVNHISGALLPSGYLGVDIFFVISGFVITSSLREPRGSTTFGGFALAFYTRRIKRLVPALVLFVAVMAVLISLVDRHPGDSLTTGLAALFGVANLELLQHATDYFALPAQLNVFTHTWSLGVEEQFYLVFPLLAWLSGYSRGHGGGPSALRRVTWLITALSLLAFVTLYSTNQPAAYYLMPTRLWELGMGCLLSIETQEPGKAMRALKRLSPTWITVAIVGVLFLPQRLGVEATTAIVLLTAILIAGLREGTIAYRLFTRPTVVYVGLISYSLYLWHGGILSLSRWTIGIHWWSVPFQLALMLGLAMASYHLMERPLRRATWSRRRWGAVLYGLAASGTVGCLVLALRGIAPAWYAGHAPAEGANRIFSCGEKGAGGPRLLVVGDSHAGQLGPLLDETPLHCMVRGEAIPAGLFPKLVTQLSDRPRRHPSPGQLDALAAQADRVESHYQELIAGLSAGDVLVLSSRYLCRLFTDCFSTQLEETYNAFFDDSLRAIGVDAARAEYVRKVVALSESLHARGVRLVVVLPTPETRQDPELCATEWFRPFVSPGCAVPDEAVRGRALIVREFQAMAAADTVGDLALFDPWGTLCGGPGSSACPEVSKDPSLMRDATHISPQASRQLYAPFLAFLRQHAILPAPAELAPPPQ
jgi:peptidoglycan/LPS O-acetylase OafA/YrhL